MEDFKNVTVVKKANVYFDGKVTSRTVLFADGSKKTLGILLPGEYEFGTADKEIMEVLAGEIKTLLPGKESWESYPAGTSFEVAANSKFKVSISEVSDYCCSYISE